MYEPNDTDLTFLTERAHGVCLDLGIGEGNSARAMLASGNVERLVGVEPDPAWRGRHGIEDARLSEGMPAIAYLGFDFAFIDHFPPHTRFEPAETLAASGTEVVVDDASLVKQPNGFHLHGHGQESFWHYDPKGESCFV
jgi:predicted O-methyltransferase YrrM